MYTESLYSIEFYRESILISLFLVEWSVTKFGISFHDLNKSHEEAVVVGRWQFIYYFPQLYTAFKINLFKTTYFQYLEGFKDHVYFKLYFFFKKISNTLGFN